jgi:hypothetical protein
MRRGDAAAAALASLRRLADLAPRVVLPAHGSIPTDPHAAFATAVCRAQRLVDDPAGAVWYGARRIFAFALMIRSGIPADEVEPYLHERAWLIDAARLLNSTSEALAAELVDGMVRATDGSTPPPSTHPSRQSRCACRSPAHGPRRRSLADKRTSTQARPWLTSERRRGQRAERREGLPECAVEVPSVGDEQDDAAAHHERAGVEDQRRPRGPLVPVQQGDADERAGGQEQVVEALAERPQPQGGDDFARGVQDARVHRLPAEADARPRAAGWLSRPVGSSPGRIRNRW